MLEDYFGKKEILNAGNILKSNSNVTKKNKIEVWMREKSWVWMDCQVTPRSLQKCQREYYNQITITRWKAASWRKKKSTKNYYFSFLNKNV